MKTKSHIFENEIYAYQLNFSKVEGRLKLLNKMKNWLTENQIPIPEKLNIEIKEKEKEKEQIYNEFCILLKKNEEVPLYH